MLRSLLVMPTYNERESLGRLVSEVLAVAPEVEILVVDDASPDGTGDLADRIAATEPRLTVLHRPAKSGLGSAYVAGFRSAIDRGFDAIVEFDADGSHLPSDLPAMLDAAARGADLVIGTRWMPGGSVVNWPAHRRFISRFGSAYARLLLRSRLRDLTSGYRVLRVPAVHELDLLSADARGYAFQIEMAWRMERAGREVAEVPIRFVERAHGRSKMTTAIVFEAVVKVALWGVRGR